MQWPQYSDFMGRLCTACVGHFQVLTAASMILPGKFAQAVADVPLDVALASVVGPIKKALVEQPNSAACLSNFLAALIHTKASLKKKTTEMRSGVSTGPSTTGTLEFTPTPKKADLKKQKKLAKLAKQFEEYDITAADASSANIIALAKEIESLAAEVHLDGGSFELGFDLKDVTRKHRQALRDHVAASSSAPVVETTADVRPKKIRRRS